MKKIKQSIKKSIAFRKGKVLKVSIIKVNKLNIIILNGFTLAKSSSLKKCKNLGLGLLTYFVRTKFYGFDFP